MSATKSLKKGITRKGTAMIKGWTLQRARSYTQYSKERPADVTPERWNAMLKWMEHNNHFELLAEREAMRNKITSE